MNKLDTQEYREEFRLFFRLGWLDETLRLYGVITPNDWEESDQASYDYFIREVGDE